MKTLSLVLVLATLTLVLSDNARANADLVFDSGTSGVARSAASTEEFSTPERKMLDFIGYDNKALAYKGKGFRRDNDGEKKNPVDCWVFVGREKMPYGEEPRYIIEIFYPSYDYNGFLDKRAMWFRGLDETIKTYEKNDTFVLTGESRNRDNAFQKISSGLFLTKKNNKLSSIDSRSSSIITFFTTQKFVACNNLEEVDFNEIKVTVKDSNLLED